MRISTPLKGLPLALAAGLTLALPLATLGCTNPTKDQPGTPAPAVSGFYVTSNANAKKTDTTNDIYVTTGDTVYARATFATTNGSAVISPGNIQVTSNSPVTLGAVTAPTTYTLTVTSGNGQTATATAKVTPVALPTAPVTAPASVTRDTTGLTASVPAVAGSTYQWSITNGTITAGAAANQVTFTSGSAGTAGAAGSMTVTCKVTSAAKVSTTGSATIPVLAVVPSGLTYAASPVEGYVNVPLTIAPPTFAGDAVQAFSVAPALPDGLTLNALTGAITGKPTTVTAPKTYVITATNSGGTATANLLLGIQPQPSISLTASPSTIGPNGGAILSWAVDSSVASFTIDQGVQTTPFVVTTVHSGTYNVAPTATTTYTMTANLVAGGTVQMPATVTLDTAPLAITSFTSEKANTTFGASDKLSWVLTGTPNTLTVNGQSVLGNTNTSVIPVRRQTFTLNAVNGAANVSQSVVVPAMGLDTVAGSINGPGMSDSATASLAQFNGPRQIAADAAGNIFIADASSHTVRRYDATTGAVTTIAGIPGFAGNLDGTTGNSQLSNPRGIAVSADGTAVYVLDFGNTAIRKIALSGGVWTSSTIAPTGTLAGNGYGQATLDPTGAFLVFVDYNQHAVKVLRLSDNSLMVYAGSTTGTSGYGHIDLTTAGPLTNARFDNPEGIAFNKAGNWIYITEAYKTTSYIRAIQWTAPAATGAMATPSGLCYTLAGAGAQGYQDGTGASAYFYGAASMCVDANDVIWVADSSNAVIRQITVPSIGMNTGVVTTFAGTTPTGTVTAPVAVTGNVDGALTAAKFNNPQGILAIGTDLYVSEVNNSTIRKINASGVTTPIGMATQPGNVDDTGTAARFSAPMGVAAFGGYAYVADNGNASLRKVRISDGQATTLATGFSAIRGVAADKNGRIYVADATAKTITEVAADGTKTTILATGLTAPQNLAVSPADPSLLYVVDGGAIFEVTVQRGTDGTFSQATITKTIGSQSQSGFVDSTTLTTTRFRTSGSGSVAGLVVDQAGNIYVADNANYAIRKIAAGTYATTTLAGITGTATYGFLDATGTSAKFNYLTGLAGQWDANGALVGLWISDRGNHAIRRFDMGTGAVTTVIGLANNNAAARIGAAPGTIGTGSNGSLYQPLGVATDSNGDLFIVTNNGLMQATLIGSAQ
ncbi:putative Ig domain-containing protein [Mesoterricola sediminis]|uniref:Uncharacterized protein n=1 Tax=Mesoterricola sediminis TaxID=2927980 RepID=A0AA48HF86_9BACT|nr:putative Ig domain-containing protein [Mesoterricola sediminis]BDU77148.1 hypothetical protein METESE_21060 [Mesoterricola sediminis]